MASEYLKWKYRDVRPDAPVERTKKQKAANWWQYHRWWLLAGLLLAAALVDIGLNALGIGRTEPDYQMAVVVSAPLEDGTIAALQRALSALGEDCNGDGRVVFEIHPYVSMDISRDSDAAQYTAAAKVKLMADLEACDSYFFLCDDPETFHANYDILAGPDGALAENGTAPYFLPCEACPALADQPLSGLCIARRGFWQDRVCRYRGSCDALWDRLTEGAEN